MDKKLLVANRGEIALRILHAARELGFETVAVHGEDEPVSPLLRAAANEIAALSGRGPKAYLNGQGLIDAAKKCGATLIHPGYGFLSENTDFAALCAENAITFVGPSADIIGLFGDKSRALEFARENGVPTIPGCPAPATLEEIEKFRKSLDADETILIKAALGGGGRGMRVLSPGQDTAEAFNAVRGEAALAFGNDTLYGEKRVENARHIEVQIIADGKGGVCHLWDRDCSLQRRHQKIVEIAPALGLDEGLRQKMLDASVKMAKASGLAGLATFEYLVEPNGSWYFIETNPRLQVEHGITEEITGVDIVAAQLDVAMGATLAEINLTTPPPVTGVAIEARINAESLAADGRVIAHHGEITQYHGASGPGIRVDSAAYRGFMGDPLFDSLVAKLIVRGRDMAHARHRLDRALEEFEIGGLPTNLAFLRGLVDQSGLEPQRLHTRYVEANLEELLSRTEAYLPEEIATALHRDDQPFEEAPAGQEAFTAPIAGLLVSYLVPEGQKVAAGDYIAVIEAMKMEHPIRASHPMEIVRLVAKTNTVVREGQPIAFARSIDSAGEAIGQDTKIDLDHIRPDLQNVLDRHAALTDAEREEAVTKRHAKGMQTARENLDQLLDPGSFIEYGALAVAAQRSRFTPEELRKRSPADGLITGIGTVNGDLFGAEASRCAVAAVDYTVMAGTQGFYHHHKLDRLLRLAHENNIPLVTFAEGGGGRPNDVDAANILLAGLNVPSFHMLASLSGKVPRVAIVAGRCFAGNAALAGVSDVIIGTKDSNLGMGGPAMIEGGGLGRYAPEEVGPASVQEANGVLDILVENEKEAVAVTRKYLSYFQGDQTEWERADQRKLRHLLPENRRQIYDMRRVIETLCDVDSVLELRPKFGLGMITALVRIEGRPLGLIANNPGYLGGAIDGCGAEKAARFLQLCDSFGLPVLSLCDTPGFMVGPEIEEQAQVRRVSRLYLAGANLTVPLFTIVIRKGYGLGAMAMAGGGFHVPVFTISWPTGEVGAMGLEGAVRLGARRQLEAEKDPEAREALFQKMVDALYEKGKAINAGEMLEFDAVIDPEDSRRWIVQGLNSAKKDGKKGSRAFVDAW